MAASAPMTRALRTITDIAMVYLLSRRRKRLEGLVMELDAAVGGAPGEKGVAQRRRGKLAGRVVVDAFDLDLGEIEGHAVQTAVHGERPAGTNLIGEGGVIPGAHVFV